MTGVEKVVVESGISVQGGGKIPTKFCGVCRNTKAATPEYFHKAKGGRYGLNNVCKECRSKQFKEKRVEKHGGKKTEYTRKEKPVVTYSEPPVINSERDAIIAILEKRIQKLQAAIEVIRETL